MAKDPIPTVVFVVASRLFIGLAYATEVAQLTLEPCTDLESVITGCADTVSVLLGAALGLIPGAHPMFNILVATISNGALVWAVMTWGRGN